MNEGISTTKKETVKSVQLTVFIKQYSDMILSNLLNMSKMYSYQELM